jgi:heme/copper-type cytochrome/quinol oxidase subunit 1
MEFFNNIVYNFLARWLFSTNHKDIGNLYLIFASLSSPTFSFLDYNNQLYNVVKGHHAVLMIFFIVSEFMFFYGMVYKTLFLYV